MERIELEKRRITLTYPYNNHDALFEIVPENNGLCLMIFNEDKKVTTTFFFNEPEVKQLKDLLAQLPL